MKPLLDLDPNDCRWPVTADKPFLFCGARKAPGSSYCACHKAMSVSADQPLVLAGRALSRMANAFGGGKVRDINKAGAEIARPAVDSLFAMSSHMPLARDFFPEATE